MPRVGVRSGSKAGIVSRMTSHHRSGTGGFCQSAGSERSLECVGITSVPLGPNTASSARITATGPPLTQPIELSEEWTSKTMPGLTPSIVKSACKDATVFG